MAMLGLRTLRRSDRTAQGARVSRLLKILPAGRERVMVRYVLPSAINCFFHVYEEHLGKYGLRVMRHVLVFPGRYAQPVMKTGCNWIVDQYDFVTVTNDVVVDRSWCKTCATAVDTEVRRGHAPTPPEQIRPVLHPLTREVL
jgi:hypothetical protein